MSRQLVRDEALCDVVEEAWCFASDIKDMVTRATPGILETLRQFEALAARELSPADSQMIEQRCAAIRAELANAKREALRYEAVLRISAPRAGYRFELPVNPIPLRIRQAQA